MTEVYVVEENGRVLFSFGSTLKDPERIMREEGSKENREAVRVGNRVYIKILKEGEACVT